MNKIKFVVPNVIEFLRNNGEVYTVRKCRPVGIVDVYFGSKLVAIGFLRFVCKVKDAYTLIRFVKKSGFEDHKDWFDVVVKIHGTRKGLRLYHLLIIRWLE